MFTAVIPFIALTAGVFGASILVTLYHDSHDEAYKIEFQEG